MIESSGRFDVQPSASNHFAWIRTQLGLQRTLMAAVRTSVSLIGFGFTVAQFFQRLQGGATDDVRHLGPEVPRNLGLVLIAAGVISLAIFTWQYRTATGYLRTGDFAAIAGVGKKPLFTSSYLVAFVVMLIGVAAFVSVFARF
jgi:putative membrane protein